MTETDLTNQQGPWRVLVDHWHLRAPEEWHENDAERFRPERIDHERSDWTGGVAYTPRQVIMWVNATREHLIRLHQITPELLDACGYGSDPDRAEIHATERKFALAGRDVRSILDIAGSRVVTWAAYRMNPTQCSLSHADAVVGRSV